MMKRLLLIALDAGVATASCSGGDRPSVLPSHGGRTARAARQAGAHVIVAPAGWAATATRRDDSGGTDRGALAPSTPMTVRLGLNLHNERPVRRRRSPRGRRSRRRSSPRSTGRRRATTCIGRRVPAGPRASPTCTAGTQLVSADGTAAQAAKAFNTSLESFSLGGAAVYVNTQPRARPELARRRRQRRARPLERREDGACTRNLTRAHRVVPHHGGADRTVRAGVQRGRRADVLRCRLDADRIGDHRRRHRGRQRLAGRHRPALRRDEAGPSARSGHRRQVGLPSPDTAGVVEWDLDTQSSTGMAQNVQTLYIYATTSLTDSDIANAYSTWVGDNIAQLGNSSFGECEYSACLDGSMKVDDHLFMQAAAQGQTMFASTGDTGSSCALAPTNGAPGSGPPMVEYPGRLAVRRRRRRDDRRRERRRRELCRRSRVERRRRRAEPVRELDQLAAGA